MIVDRVPHPRTSAEVRAGPAVKDTIWTTRSRGSAIDADIYDAKDLAFLRRRARGSPSNSSPQRQPGG